jgi:putative phosphoesterase
MKIGIISDIHIDDSPDGTIVDAIIQAVREADLSLLLMPGDFSCGWRSSLAAIARIEDGTGLRVLFVPGNHDLWNKLSPDETPEFAQEQYEKHPGCLSGRVVTIDGWNFVGETGWYDETLTEGRFTASQIAEMYYGGRTWQDSRFTRWHIPMMDKTDEYLHALETTLAGLDPTRTIVSTHVIPRLEFSVQPPEGIWTYFNGLLGSARYGELFSRAGVRAAVCGHVHYRKRFTADGVEWICACLGTPNEWYGKDPLAEVRSSLAILEL